MRGDLESPKLCAQSRGKLGRHAGSSAEQEERETAPHTHGRQRPDQVDTGDRSIQLASLPPGGPHHTGAVGKAQVRRLEHLPELGVFLRVHNELRVDGGDLVMPAKDHELLDAIEGSAHVEAVHPHPQDPCLLWRHYSTSSTVTVLHGIGVPRFLVKSAIDSPPPTRMRVHIWRSALVCSTESIVVTAVS